MWRFWALSLSPTCTCIGVHPYHDLIYYSTLIAQIGRYADLCTEGIFGESSILLVQNRYRFARKYLLYEFGAC